MGSTPIVLKINSTTNQHTSTNAAVTVGAGTVDIPQAIILDISDTAGKINGVSVSPNDTLIVQFKRESDAATGSARHMSFASEVSFT